MVERCAGWYQRFAPDARLELADDSVDVVTTAALDRYHQLNN